MNTKDARSDLCSISAFAELCGVSAESVIRWLDNGTLPGVQLSDTRLVNLAQICDDLDKGKTTFTEGEYSHDR